MNDQYPLIQDLFPQKNHILLTGGGKEFIERVGIETARQAIYHVMLGENLREHTEPLTRRRLAQVSAGIFILFLEGGLALNNFPKELTKIVSDQLLRPPVKKNRRTRQVANQKQLDIVNKWVANWLIGLTGKGQENVTRNKPEQLVKYIADFERAIQDSTAICEKDLKKIQMAIGYTEDKEKRQVLLDWQDILMIATAIGSQTLTIRGSDKSIYGKLFERLILGSFLSILGFTKVIPKSNQKTEKVFWLSDSSGDREADATLLLSPGKIAKFDIGFIGKGNPEISKDKLSRYEREIEINAAKASSTTVIIVDRLPDKSKKTAAAAKRLNAELIQMSMQYWPRLLTNRLCERLGFQHELQKMKDEEIGGYLQSALKNVKIEEFLAGVSVTSLQEESEKDETIEQGNLFNELDDE